MTTARDELPEANQTAPAVVIRLDRPVRPACQGGKTVDCRNGSEHGQRCRECGSWVRDDMTDHPFFGFKAGCSR